MLQFVCDVVKDTGEEEYLRPFIRIGLDWISQSCIFKQPNYTATGRAVARCTLGNALVSR